MQKRKRFFYSGLLFLVAATACQKDDICPETTPTTPLLIIRFYDFDNPSELKPAPRLNLIAEGRTDSLFTAEETTDSIAIPLKTFQNSTHYQFIINLGEEGDTQIPENSDVVNFSYATNEVYVSQACGFKTEYLDLQSNRVSEPNGTNWILNIEVEKTIIENETSAHISVFH